MGLKNFMRKAGKLADQYQNFQDKRLKAAQKKMNKQLEYTRKQRMLEEEKQKLREMRQSRYGGGLL